MINAKSAVIVVGTALAVFVGSGCVSQKKFRRTVEQTDSRVGSVETAVEENERRLGDLRDDTDRKVAQVERQAEQAYQVGNQAMTTAEKAARGRLIWDETLSDDKVKFKFGRAALSDDAKGALNPLIDQIKGYGKAVYVEIEGHTDNTGDAQYNRHLAEERAMAVRDYLNEQGIPLHAMNVIAHGEDKPIADNKDRGGRALNRRVVIRVLE